MAKPRKTLTTKQERFCLAFVETGNASEAYRRAYNAERMKQGTITRMASKLLKNHLVATTVESLKAKIAEGAIMTARQRQEWWSKVMLDEEHDIKARLRASELLGKAQGDFIERRIITREDTPRTIEIDISD